MYVQFIYYGRLFSQDASNLIIQLIARYYRIFITLFTLYLLRLQSYNTFFFNQQLNGGKFVYPIIKIQKKYSTSYQSYCSILSKQIQLPSFNTIQHPDHKIRGLAYVRQFITKDQQVNLIKNILQQQWNTTLKRRTQHYGFQYSYEKKNVAKQTQPLPQWCSPVKISIQQFIIEHSPQHQKPTFDQLIINEYQPGQGINPHTDKCTLFGSPIVSLGLGSDCIMQFDRQQYPWQSIQLKLNRRSIVILDQEARYNWKHSIPARKKDQGKARSVRYSMTFRLMNKQ